MSTPISVRFPDEVARRLRGAARERAKRPRAWSCGWWTRESAWPSIPASCSETDPPVGARVWLRAPTCGRSSSSCATISEGGATEAVRRAAKWLSITEAQVRTAESYYASFPDEIDDRVEMNEAAAGATQRAGEVRRRLYG